MKAGLLIFLVVMFCGCNDPILSLNQQIKKDLYKLKCTYLSGQFYRCENSEVVCYQFGKSISCFKKEF